MSDLALDGLSRSRLDWPEPLLIDLISESYGTTPDLADRVVAARLHTRFLHELVDGDGRASAFLRLELIASCAARRISVDAIERADQMAFRELQNVVTQRFRMCARMRELYLSRLSDAMARLPERDAPQPQPAPVRQLPARAPTLRAPLLLRKKLAISA